MQISYKWWYIKRDDDGFITEATVRFYEGDNQEVDIRNVLTGEVTKETRYVRTRRLHTDELSELAGSAKQETDGTFVRVYTENNFGKIKTDNELRLFANKELAKQKTWIPQTDQSEIEDINKVK